jgi:hypothetical protein
MAANRKSTTLGLPSGRLAQLIVETTTAEPYIVTDKITIAPLTKKRSKELADAMSAMGVCNALLQQAMKRTPQAPEYPKMPTAPEHSDANTLAAYDASIDKWTLLVADWEKRQKAWETEVDQLEASMNDLSDKLNGHSDEYSKVLFGPAYDDVMAFFEDQPVEYWNVFVEDIRQEFGLVAKPEQKPDDGCCMLCGNVVDEEAAGKVPESST